MVSSGSADEAREVAEEMLEMLLERMIVVGVGVVRIALVGGCEESVGVKSVGGVEEEAVVDKPIRKSGLGC